MIQKLLKEIYKEKKKAILFSNHGYLEKSFGEIILCEISQIARTDCFSIDQNSNSLLMKFFKLNYKPPQFFISNSIPETWIE